MANFALNCPPLAIQIPFFYKSPPPNLQSARLHHRFASITIHRPDGPSPPAVNPPSLYAPIIAFASITSRRRPDGSSPPAQPPVCTPPSSLRIHHKVVVAPIAPPPSAVNRCARPRRHGLWGCRHLQHHFRTTP